MTTVQITLPDELARKASAAGLLESAEIATMLRERLNRNAGGSLRDIWARLPHEELTPRIEQEIAEAIEAARAENRQGSR